MLDDKGDRYSFCCLDSSSVKQELVAGGPWPTLIDECVLASLISSHKA